MAVSVTALLTEIDDADSATGWSGNSGALDTFNYVEGGGTPGSFAWLIRKNSTEACTFTPATNINMNTPGYTYKHLYFWMKCDMAPFMTSRATDGFMLRLTDGSGNYTEWTMAGNDTWRGEWRRFILDLANTSDVTASSGTLSFTDIDIVTYTVNSQNVSYRAVDNAFNDVAYFGEGLKATGTAFALQDIADVDSTLANQYGVLQSANDILFCQGKLEIGDASTQTTFSSAGEVLVFVDPTVAGLDGGAVGSVHASLYKVTTTGNSSNSTISWTGGVIRASGTVTYVLDMDHTGFQTIAFTGMTVSQASEILCWADGTNGNFSGNTFDSNGVIYPKGSKFENNTINNTTETTYGAVYISDTATAAAMKNINFNTYASKYAVYIPASVTGTIVFDNWQFDNSGTKDVYWAGTGGTLTISKTNGSNPTDYDSAGGTVSFVGPTTTVTAKVTTEDGTDIQNARVFIATTAIASGGLPYQAAITSISRSGTLATVNFTADHKLITGDKITLQGITGDKITDNNRVFTVTYVDTDTVTYTTADTGGSYTGTITATYVLIKGLTDASGELSLDRVYPVVQNIGGWARKSTDPDFFKEGPMSGAISTTADATLSAVLVSDD